MQVWEKSVNAAGGINGHPVNVIIKDDGGSPTTALSDAKQLVQQNKIIAMVGEVSTNDGTFGPYMQSAKVPVVGGQSSDTPFTSNPYFFGTGAGLNTVTYGLWATAKSEGKTTAGELYCAEAPVCAEYSTVSGASAQLLGMSYSGLKTSSTLPSYTAQCTTMKSKGVTVLSPALAAATAAEVVDQCVQLGYKPQLVEAGGSVGSAILTDPNFAGTIVTQSQGSYTDANFPGTAQMLAAFKKYNPSIVSSPEFNYEVQAAWLGGQLFEAASKAYGGFTPSSTPADVLQGLYKINGDTLGGVAPPLHFVAGKATLSNCYFVQKVENKQLTSVGTKPTCVSNATADALDAKTSS